MNNMMIKAEMSREDKLYSMKGDMLIAECDKLGVKVNCNKTRTQLKESKAKVIERILAFESEVDNSISVADEPVIEAINDSVSDTSSKKESKEIKNNNDLVNIFKSFGYDLKRTNRKNAETYTFKVNNITVEVCHNKKGITLYCSKNIITNSIEVGKKFKTTDVDIHNLKNYIKEM